MFGLGKLSLRRGFFFVTGGLRNPAQCRVLVQAGQIEGLSEALEPHTCISPVIFSCVFHPSEWGWVQFKGSDQGWVRSGSTVCHGTCRKNQGTNKTASGKKQPLRWNSAWKFTSGQRVGGSGGWSSVKEGFL